ncbi:MAG: PAS domain-containing protein [Tissierellia bacterium]|nr:PAS domain-containing protein [Tissierellia bacterium]
MLSIDKKRELLEKYVTIADFIATVAGNNCEVVLRDYHQGKSSILHIINGKLSDRKEGDSIRGYALNKIMKEDYKEKDYVSNYIIINESNQRVFRASTFYIMEGEELIGLLCVNYDLSDMLKYRDFYDREILYGFEQNSNLQKEYFDESMDSILDGMIKNVFIHWDRSIPANKIEFEGNPIRQLYRLGVFNYKGAVAKVAELLDISIQTIYRYLKELEREGGDNSSGGLSDLTE